MKRPRFLIILLVITFLLDGDSSIEGSISGGRIIDKDRDFEINGVIGSIVEMQGFVQETTRAYYDATEQQFKQDLAERFDLDDFDMDGGFPTAGVAIESFWKYFTLQVELLFMNPQTDAHAQRNYYISVGNASFDGQEFNNQKIPEGMPFSAEIFGVVTEVNGLFTPVTIQASKSVRFTPWIGVGAFMFLGEYEIDAGEPMGLVQYQFPPENFVVGGTSTGHVGAGILEIGIGGEMMFGSSEGVNLIIESHLATFQYQGSTRYLTTSRSREKDADINHMHGWIQGELKFPLKSGRALTVGGKLNMVRSSVDITSEPGTPEEVIARRERFDKQVDFEMTIAMFFFGVTF